LLAEVAVQYAAAGRAIPDLVERSAAQLHAIHQQFEVLRQERAPTEGEGVGEEAEGEGQEEGDDDSEDEETVYDVEKIVGKRTNNKQTEYCVRWRGYTYSHDTWEPLAHLEKAAAKVEEFEAGRGLQAIKAELLEEGPAEAAIYGITARESRQIIRHVGADMARNEPAKPAPVAKRQRTARNASSERPRKPTSAASVDCRGGGVSAGRRIERPHSSAEQQRKSERERRERVRPAPDTLSTRRPKRDASRPQPAVGALLTEETHNTEPPARPPRRAGEDGTPVRIRA
jgi:hypothetical protein